MDFDLVLREARRVGTAPDQPTTDIGGVQGRIAAAADLVVLDAPDAVMALRTIAPVLAAYKNGRRTVTREPVQLHRP